MKKLFCKKLISAFLATVMLLAMIPAGMISAVAGGPGYSVDGTTITITTAEGWNTVADKSEYATYDFVLDGEIDFNSTTEDKPLFSNVTFNGTFNGQGNTIRNFSGEVAAVIAYEAQSLAANDLVEVTNVKLDKISLTGKYTNDGGKIVAGTIFADVIGDHEIKINEVSITDTSIVSSEANISIGGVIGSMSCNGGVQIDKINFEGELKNTTESGGTAATGGIVGESRFSVSTSAKTSTISNCHVNATLIQRSQNGRASGIAGFWGRGSSSSGYSTDLEVKDCYLQGKYSVYKGGEKGRTGAVLGDCRLASGATVTIEDVVTDAVLDQYAAISGTAVPDNKKCTSAGYLISFGATTTTYNVINCATTVTEDKPAVHNNTAASALKGLTADKMAQLVSYQDGYISDVDIRDLLPKTYIQTSSVDSKTNTYIIRFVIESIVKNYDKVTTKIVVKNGEGGEVVKTFTFDECTYFESLTGHKADITETYVAGEGAYKDCECFIAVAIMDVPNDGTDYYFEVTPTFTLGGITVEGTTFGGSYAAGRPATN